jgi:hypothetical protein
MKRAGAAGDDWSDWDRHLPTSPSSSDVPDSQASSLSRTLSKQTSDKFELTEGVWPSPLLAPAQPVDGEHTKAHKSQCYGFQKSVMGLCFALR